MNLAEAIKRIVALGLATGVAAIAVTMRATGAQAVQGQLSAIQPQAAMQIQALIDDKASRTPAQNRIDSQLLYKHKMAHGLPVAPGIPTLNVQTTTAPDGREIVDVTATNAMGLVPVVQQLGATVLFADDRMLRLQTTLDSLESIAGLSGVVFIHPPLYPQHQHYTAGMTSVWRRQLSMPVPWTRDVLRARLQSALVPQPPRVVTAVDSEGDTTHKAITARSTYGVHGGGIKVGVLSSGVDGLAASQAAGALGAVTVLPGQAGQGNEGTAMLEIIHDLAGAAQLYFATDGPTITQFAMNIRALQAAGCNIIVDDVFFLNETPFQDGQTASVVSTTNAGVVIQAVKDVAAAGVMYFSSAGNYGLFDAGVSGTWEGDFVDSGFIFTFDSKPLNLFGVVGSTPYPYNTILEPGAAVTLSWDDPLGQSNNDYDLFLIDGTLGTIKAGSTNLQTGTQDPWEFVNVGGAAGDKIFVVKFSGSARYLHLETVGGSLVFQTPGSTHGHNSTTAATSFGVAAVPATTGPPNSCGGAAVPSGPYPNPFSAANVVECFSSDGPRRIFFNGDGSAITPNNFLGGTNGGRILVKPDFAAADGVSVSGAGFVSGSPFDDVETPFFGTSAAAPHAAAIAALVWSRDLKQLATQVKADLLASAIDIMAPGVDRDSGVGILMADAAVANYTCTYSIDLSSLVIGPAVTGPILVGVAAGIGCPWTASTTAPFVSITTGVSGKGNGIVSMVVAANTSTVTRMATVTIAGQPFTITQNGNAPSCTFGIDRASQAIASAGASTSVTVTAAPGCVWTASTDATFVSITNASGTGNGTVGMIVAANFDAAARIATVTIAEQTFTITQDGNAPLCTYGIDRPSQTIASAGGATSVTVTAGAGCAWAASTAATFVTITSGNNGTGNGTVSMTVAANTATAARMATVTIAGQVFTITQDGLPPPSMTLDRSLLIFTAVNNGATFTAVTGGQAVRLTQTGIGAVSWTASSSAPSWLVVSPTSGAGSATLVISPRFTAGLAPAQVGTITITLTGAGNSVGPITVTLNSISPAAAAPPFGSFDTPTNGVTGVAGSIGVTGWALDRVQVTRVTVCRDAFGSEVAPVDPNCASNAGIYIGDAVFVDGARPDVQAANSTLPLSSRAGWGYLMLTNFLPNLGNGTFNLRAYAFDAEGLTNALGVKTITCNNASSFAPFGAIDTPAQGAVVSGAAFGNTGWVLEQGPGRADPPGGGIVNVFVDGTNVGSPSLWTSRSDLQALFPAASYPGINTALGIFGLNTTTLPNGVHTIFWLATGTGTSGTSGIGSRFITVSNGAETLDPNASAAPTASVVIPAASMLDLPPAAAARIASPQGLDAEIAAAPRDLTSVSGRRGFDLDRALQTYAPSGGRIDVQAEELDRVELHLSGTAHHQYSGYLHTPAGLRPLPVGSSLDAPTGAFTWAPGVGFYGTYDLTFVQWSSGRAVARQDVRITLNAKGSNRVGPQTVIDVPSTDALVGSPFFLGGWAADLDSSVDSGVNTVHVWAYPLDANGNRLDPVFIGPASYAGARPDVRAVYGDRFANSGFGIIVNGLAPGTYDVAVFAFSTVVNNFTPAKIVRVVVRCCGQ